jgi:hypothetical protein
MSDPVGAAPEHRRFSFGKLPSGRSPGCAATSVTRSGGFFGSRQIITTLLLLELFGRHRSHYSVHTGFHATVKIIGFENGTAQSLFFLIGPCLKRGPGQPP